MNKVTVTHYKVTTAGPEMDALVAEHVLGWKPPTNLHTKAEIAISQIQKGWRDQNDEYREKPYPFSTSNQHAQLVVRAMIEKPFELKDRFFAMLPGWLQTTPLTMSDIDDKVVLDELDPEQVCLAALEAVGVPL